MNARGRPQVAPTTKVYITDKHQFILQILIDRWVWWYETASYKPVGAIIDRPLQTARIQRTDDQWSPLQCPNFVCANTPININLSFKFWFIGGVMVRNGVVQTRRGDSRIARKRRIYAISRVRTARCGRFPTCEATSHRPYDKIYRTDKHQFFSSFCWHSRILWYTISEGWSFNSEDVYAVRASLRFYPSPSSQIRFLPKIALRLFRNWNQDLAFLVDIFEILWYNNIVLNISFGSRGGSNCKLLSYSVGNTSVSWCGVEPPFGRVHFRLHGTLSFFTLDKSVRSGYTILGSWEFYFCGVRPTIYVGRAA